MKQPRFIPHEQLPFVLLRLYALAVALDCILCAILYAVLTHFFSVKASFLAASISGGVVLLYLTGDAAWTYLRWRSRN